MILTVKDSDKRSVVMVAQQLVSIGFQLIATDGTYKVLNRHGIACERVNKVHEGRPHVVDLIKSREIHLIINTPLGKVTRHDDGMIRSESYQANIPCLTTMSAASAAVEAIRVRQLGKAEVRSLQDYFPASSTTAATPQDRGQLGEVVR